MRTDHLDDLPVAVGRGQVERSVVAHVGGVNPGPAGDQHLHDLHVTALGGPVQGGELVVVTAIRGKHQISVRYQGSNIFNVLIRG